MINNTLGSGLEGIRNGTLGMQDAANRIARAGTVEREPANAQAQQGGDPGQRAPEAEAGGGLAEPIIDLRLNQRGVEASVEVVRTADEMVGTLLDEQA